MTEQHRQHDEEAMVRFLRRVRSWARWLLIARAVFMWITVALVGLIVGGLLDFALRAPSPIRSIGLILAVGFGFWALIRHVVPAFVFRPSLAEVALRVERQSIGRGGETRGLLASAVELAQARASDPFEESLRVRTVREASARIAGLKAIGVLRPSLAIRAAVGFVAVVLVSGALAISEPEYSRIGLSRLLAPWSGVQWPRRQVVVDAMDKRVHAMDEALAMRAGLVKTNRGPGRTPVSVWYRGVTEDRVGKWKSALLTSQHRRVINEATGASGGDLYERLIDPAEVFSGLGGKIVSSGWIEYRFTTEDDRTRVSRVRVVEPPEVLGATIDVRVPEYASDAVIPAQLTAGSGLELGAGDDERALVRRVLAGSSFLMRVQMNKTVPAVENPGWAAELLEHGREVSVAFEGDVIRIGGIIDESARIALEAVDEFGVSSRGESVYVLEVVSDESPEPVVREPDHDEELVAGAVIEVVGAGRDDLGLARLRIERVVASVPDGSEGAGVEAKGDWEPLAIRAFSGQGDGEIGARVDLGSMGVSAGDEVWLSVVAVDSYAEAGLGREPVRSRVRRIAIIDESELIEQIQAALGALRDSAIRLDAQQEELMDRLSDGEAAERIGEMQRGLTNRIGSQVGVLERFSERLDRNGVDDSVLEALIESSRSAVTRAAESSGRAQGSLRDMGLEDESERQRLAEEAGEQQKQVREALGQLIEQLDRGKDGWVARRSIERLLEEQRELSEQTGAIGSRLLGRSGDELTPSERTELDRIADRQREVSRRVSEAIDELGERGEQLSDSDPAQSAAMAEAQREGQKAGVSESLEQAAEDISGNRTSQAQSKQDQAMEAMEEMLESLENASRQRNAALLRKIASLLESLENLIGAQERSIEGLLAKGTGLDVEMIRLRGNTLAVGADAGGADLAVVRSLIEGAARAQGEAVIALRHEPVEWDQAQRREQESLLKLNEARAEAQRLEAQAQKAEQDEKRRELRQAYRDQLEQEIVLREEAGGLAGEKLTRRERAKARGIGQRQETVRQALDDLVKSTTELQEAGVFSFVHRRLDSATGVAVERLFRGEVDERTLQAQETAISLLRSLVEVLDDQEQNQKDFDEGAGGSGGGNGGSSGEDQPLLPPIAELRLLRAMQAEVVERARAMDDSGDADAASIEELGALQREIEVQAKDLIERMKQQDGQNPDQLPVPDGEVQG